MQDRIKPGDVLTFPIQWIKPFNSDPMPHVGREFGVGRKIAKITDVRIREGVFDAVILEAK